MTNPAPDLRLHLRDPTKVRRIGGGTNGHPVDHPGRRGKVCGTADDDGLVSFGLKAGQRQSLSQVCTIVAVCLPLDRFAPLCEEVPCSPDEGVQAVDAECFKVAGEPKPSHGGRDPQQGPSHSGTHPVGKRVAMVPRTCSSWASKRIERGARQPRGHAPHVAMHGTPRRQAARPTAPVQPGGTPVDAGGATHSMSDHFFVDQCNDACRSRFGEWCSPVPMAER